MPTTIFGYVEVIMVDKDNSQARVRETYLLANRNPWMLWRLQALRAGYIPPLLPGQIPPELAGIMLGHKDREYAIDPLLEQAKKVRGWQRGLISKFFMVILTVTLLLGSLGIAFSLLSTTRFKVSLVDVLLPRNDEQVILWYK